MTADTPAVLYVSIDRSGLSPVPVASFHKHPGAEEWIPLDAVRVKPLEWEESEGNFPSQRVWSFDALKWMWIVQNDGGNFVWCEDVTPSWAPASNVRGVFPTLEAAKAAAQADYEARILSALALPAPDEGAQEEGE